MHVREFAVPPPMIESATARRAVGDWAGACAAARVDVDLNLRAVARTRGRQLADRIRADLRRLAPDLLRWHLPRVAPDGLLRPGLTVSLARYGPAGSRGGAVHLVARTPPAWADAGQRISLALWDGSGFGDGPYAHPHPHPDRRFRLDLHRHLWDAHRAGELRERSGAGRPATVTGTATGTGTATATGTATGSGAATGTAAPDPVPKGSGCAVERWAAEAALLLDDRGRGGDAVTVRLGGRHRLVLRLRGDTGAGGPPAMTLAPAPAKGGAGDLPVLPDAATWVPPDLELLRAGLIDAGRLHPLVARALVPGHQPSGAPRTPEGAGDPHLVECRGDRHRIGLVDGKLVPLDHDPAEIRREELLAALGGNPLPCLRAIDEAHRHPECLVGVRARLDHGDDAGALATVESLLGPDALLRGGALRDELETAALRRVSHGLFRAGLAGLGPPTDVRDTRREVRTHPRHARHPRRP
ncbi:hypothetical protein GCM10023322_36170 [Rugosimonospora acidiphila]|uniref:Uncharacterized protein n=1 Tax=Rugosimonospora acidiphila TaxID=556531 RepID=A0ABP9RW03_9ACTN